jgi:epoxyqueuosine reductase QueG
MTKPAESAETIKNELRALGADIVGFGGGVTICGKCIEVCPHTRRYLDADYIDFDTENR